MRAEAIKTSTGEQCIRPFTNRDFPDGLSTETIQARSGHDCSNAPPPRVYRVLFFFAYGSGFRVSTAEIMVSIALRRAAAQGIPLGQRLVGQLSALTFGSHQEPAAETQCDWQLANDGIDS